MKKITIFNGDILENKFILWFILCKIISNINNAFQTTVSALFTALI